MIQSQWLTIALYAGFIQGFFLIILLQQRKDANRPAINWLLALIGIVSVLMILRVSYQPWFFRELAEIILLPDVVLFLTGPFMYFFTRAMLRKDRLEPGLRFLHFLPSLIHVLIVNTFLGLNMKGYLELVNQSQLIFSFHLIEFSAIISLVFYLILSWKTYLNYRKSFYEKYTAPFLGDFFRVFFLSVFVLWLFWFGGFLMKVIQANNNYLVYTLFWVSLVAVFYLVAYKILSNPEVLAIPKLIPVITEVKVVFTTAQKESLLAFILLDRPYLDPYLKIGDLATKLEVPKHELSKWINQGFCKNFFDFINAFRVQKFVELYENTNDRQVTFLELAFQSGFNSKSAFNRAFRKETGMSPSQYFANPKAILKPFY